MTIVEDTRQQDKKHLVKQKYFADNGIKVVRSKLPLGDYANIKDMSVIVDTKRDIQEIIGNVVHQHERFIAECQLAKDSDIQLIVLIENTDNVNVLADLAKWYNKRLIRNPKATKGITLFKILYTIQKKYGVKFEFCHPYEAGEKVIELLKNQT